MENIQYCISATFYRRNAAVKQSIVQIEGKTYRQQSSSKPKAEGYRVSMLESVNPNDSSDFKAGKEVKEFSIKYVTDEDGNMDIIPAHKDDEGARTFFAPFNTLEVAVFIQAYGTVNGNTKEIYNARVVSRSNCGEKDVVYVAAIGAPIQKTLLAPELREKIVDEAGVLKPEFREKFGKKTNQKSTKKRSAVVSALADQI